MNFRDARVGKLIREELSKLIGRELEFSGSLVTITEVIVDGKLEHAKVLVSVIPTKEADAALAALRRAQGRLQRLLLRKMNIKPMPRIAFEFDHGVENAANVEKKFLETKDSSSA